ncbi:MAG: CvpA family protein [Myxococcaceae bacterium]
MNLDLVLGVVVLVFALLGAFAGAAKQVANLVALVAAYACARPLGTALGPRAAQAAGTPLIVATVGATLLVFLVVMVVGRYAITRLLRRVLAGKNPSSRGVDRTLGFLLGGLKVAAIAYVIICALTFVEQNVKVAGKRLGLSPKGSIAFELARKYNLFEMTQFSSVQDLVKVAKGAQTPDGAARLKSDPAFLALKKDPRFLKALDEQAMRKAIETGDYRSLLRSNVILQLIQDPTASARLSAAADAAERR